MERLNFGRVKPSFMIIGVQKGGTSSMYYYLKQHPQIIAPKLKELHYFDKIFITSEKNYLNKFPHSYFTRKLSFDATPRYIYYPGTSKRIYDFNPKMKFIVLLRDPVKRAFSAWNMYKQMKNLPIRQTEFINLEKEHDKEKIYSYFYKNNFPTFEEWIEIELDNSFDQKVIEPSIIRRGYYLEQIEDYLKYFKLESFLFLDFESFKNSVNESLEKVANFLDIASFKNISIDLSPKNVRPYKDELTDELYQRLKIHYQKKNKGIEELIGLKLKWMTT